MRLDQVLMLKFPDECNAFKIYCTEDSKGDLIIDHWDMGDVPLPDKATLSQWKIEAEAILIANTINDRILKKLHEIDLQSIRPLRANDATKLSALESEAVELRAQLVEPFEEAAIMEGR